MVTCAMLYNHMRLKAFDATRHNPFPFTLLCWRFLKRLALYCCCVWKRIGFVKTHWLNSFLISCSFFLISFSLYAIVSCLLPASSGCVAITLKPKAGNADNLFTLSDEKDVPSNVVSGLSLVKNASTNANSYSNGYAPSCWKYDNPDGVASNVIGFKHH